MKKLFFILLLLLVLASCRDLEVKRGKSISEEVRFNTSDNFTIVGHYYPSEASKGILLLHMLGKHSSSYESIAEDLVSHYQVLAIDFRGHGDSDGDLTLMTDSEFKLVQNDVVAAMEFFKSLGVEDISIVGASIGANAALLYASQHGVDKLVLISPGGIYKGLDITRTSFDGPALVQVAYYDAYASLSVDDLEGNWFGTQIKRYNAADHGTDLIKNDEEAYADFLNFLWYNVSAVE